jgi:seryl-tRNA synthetase
MYHVGEDDLFLNPTAEVPVTNIYREEILEPGMVPRYLTAYCASYRREAGAPGKETRGMVRVPPVRQGGAGEDRGARDQLRRARELAREVSAVFEALELPYRVVLLCSGDLSFAAAKCYDFEVFAAGEPAVARSAPRARTSRTSSRAAWGCASAARRARAPSTRTR